MRRGRSACASLRSMLMNGVIPMPPAIITIGAVGLVVQAHRSRRADDPHARVGRSDRERLFVGALAHAGGDREPVLVGRGCEREAPLAWRSSLAPGKSSGRKRSIDSPGVNANPPGFSK